MTVARSAPPVNDTPVPSDDGENTKANRFGSGPGATAATVQASLSVLDDVDDIAVCLWPLLEALGWRGDARSVAEALPHFAERLDPAALRDVLALLGYASVVVPAARCDRIDSRLLPCLLIRPGAPALVLLRATGRGQVMLFDPAIGRIVSRDLRALKGDIYLFTRAEGHDGAREAAESGRWIWFIVARFRGLFARIAGLTFLTYLLAVTPAVFIMVLYDQVIPSGSLTTLQMLLAGAVMALLGEAGLRLLRGRLFAHIGSRLNILVAGGIFSHLLRLPLALSERMRLGSQVQRLRQTDTIRDIFSGSAATTIVELPFALVFLVALALLGGWLAAVPLAAALIYCAIAWLMAPRMTALTSAAARQGLERQDFLFETVARHDAVRMSGATAAWRRRYRELSGRAAFSTYKAAQASAAATAVGQSVMVMTGMLTIALGAVQVMNAQMSVGALIAVMTLTWRAISPLQAGFLLLTRLGQLQSTINGLNQAMKSPQEMDGTTAGKDVAVVQDGKVALSRVSFRYASDMDPALLGVSAEFAPGEVVAITGPNGSGKSTVLKVILGLYQPQAGSIHIDDIDIRQHAAITVRQAIGYVPQDFELFFGTVMQNLRLSMPTATRDRIEAATRRAGVHDLIEGLPDGYAHRVGDQKMGQISTMLLNGIALAAAYARQPRVLLIDEVIDNLDNERTALFYEELDRMRGETTVILVTHRPSTMRKADRLLVINNGMVAKNGKPADIL
ncbi:peptidase domain-containing ABC transporter [Fodinicurvata sp. EGI_FJ10296]|uniref:peptidase domain-containing ABC transporter n=1 Tax=Fodinicurvata sp. EGI_FJ10296 TaxID=3231908 RepID=UPI003453B4A9